MRAKIGEIDPKSKGICKNIGFVIYLHCIFTVQESLRRAENYANISLEGSLDKMDSPKLINQVLEVIAKESLSKIAKTGIDLLTKIHIFNRSKSELVCDFVTRFT